MKLSKFLKDHVRSSFLQLRRVGQNAIVNTNVALALLRLDQSYKDWTICPLCQKELSANNSFDLFACDDCTSPSYEVYVTSKYTLFEATKISVHIDLRDSPKSIEIDLLTQICCFIDSQDDYKSTPIDIGQIKFDTVAAIYEKLSYSMMFL